MRKPEATHRNGITAWLGVIVLTASTAGGCTIDSPPAISPFPIDVDVSSGPMMVSLELPDAPEGEDNRALIDTMSPITIIDSFRLGGALPQPRRQTLDIGLISASSGAEPVVQARLPAVDTFDIHPCALDGDAEQVECRVGIDNSTEVIQGILGADALSRYAVRIDTSAPSLQFFPDIAGNDIIHSRMCEAVFSQPFHGGGNLVIGGAERPYTGWRVAIGACFINTREEVRLRLQNPDSEALWIAPTAGLDQGLDALFLMSTGIGMTIMSESSYQRYQQNRPILTGEDPELPPTGTVTVHLPNGQLEGRLGTISQISLVSEMSDQRGPCGERYANHYLERRLECDGESPELCPCSDDAAFCRTASAIDLCGEFQVAVVPDSEPLLQGLRDELRPALPEIDGIIGTDILRYLRADIDYPNGRIMFDCAAAGDVRCGVRPAVLSRDALEETRTRCPRPLTCGLPDPDQDVPDKPVP
ncbi:MAG: hypothetical protein AAGC55_06185 [Myxococcota bacterium]